MTIEYAIDHSQDMVITRFIGRVDNEQLENYINAARRDPSFMACASSLIDLSELTDAAFDAATIRSIAMSRPAVPGRKIAIIAPADVSFGLARVFQGFGSLPAPESVQVFRDRAAANEWLRSD
jgi:hypothetical protein